jgi:hypothetical protein
MLFTILLLAAPIQGVENNPSRRVAKPTFSSQQTFPGQPGLTLTRLGTAHRERLGILQYTVALYADLSALKRRSAGELRGTDKVASLLREGDLPVSLVLSYHQSISAERRREFNQQALERCWPGPGFDPQSAGYRAFATHFKDPIQRGGVFQVWIQKGVISMRTANGPVDRVAYPELCRAFLACYLSETNLPGETRTLRDELLQELSQRLQQP